MASGTLTSNPDQVAVDAPTTTVAPSADDLPPDNTTAVA